eukprot:5150280-Amphidinium_carterae.1
MRAFLEDHLASAGACIRDAWQGPTCEQGQVRLAAGFIQSRGCAFGGCHCKRGCVASAAGAAGFDGGRMATCQVLARCPVGR